MLRVVRSPNPHPHRSRQGGAQHDAQDGGANDNVTTGPLGLVAQIIEDWKTHGRDSTRPGFQALAVHRFGNWRMRIGPKIVRAPFSVLYRVLYRSVRNFYGIELPYTARVGRRVTIEHQSGIVIHGASEIGDDCVIHQDVTLGNQSPDRPLDAPKVGNRVNIGAGAKVLGAVHIGDDVRIGANAVVIDDVPAAALAVGVPARVRGSARPEEPSR